MKLKVVVLAKPWQPEAAQMVWRLLATGFEVLPLLQKQERNFFRDWRAFLQYSIRKIFKKTYSNPVYLSAEEIALDHPVRIVSLKSEDEAEIQTILEEAKPDAGILMGNKILSNGILTMLPHGFLNLQLQENSITIARGSAVLAHKKLPIFNFDNPATLREKSLWYGTFLVAAILHRLASGFDGLLPMPEEQASLPVNKDLPRVLHIITRMVRGGAQKNTLATVAGLSQKNYDVTLVSGPSWGTEDEILHEALEQNLKVLILPELVREISLLADLLAVWKLRVLMAKNSFAIVHTHTSKAGLLGRLAAHWAKVPMIVHTPHGHVFHSYFSTWKEQIFLWMERLAAPWTHRLVALTSRCRDEHLKLKVGNPEQWVVIPSGVDEKNIEDFSARRNEILDSLKIPRDRKIIGYIGRLAPVKGCFYLIRALLPVYWAKLNFHCLIVGDGEDRKSLENLAAGIGLKSRVTFAGYQKNISKFLSVFNLLVVPSLNEGMGRVIVEAGFLEKPIVATRVGGIVDLIENERTGLLVPPRDSDLLACAITDLLENPAKAAEFSENLHRKILKDFTESRMVEKIHQLYQQLSGGEQSRIPSSGFEETGVLKEETQAHTL